MAISSRRWSHVAWLRELLHNVSKLLDWKATKGRRSHVAASAKTHAKGQHHTVIGSLADCDVVVLAHRHVEAQQLTAIALECGDPVLDALGRVLDVPDSLICELHQNNITLHRNVLFNGWLTTWRTAWISPGQESTSV